MDLLQYSQKFGFTLINKDEQIMQDLPSGGKCYLTDCEHHPFAYSLADKEGGSLSMATVKRALDKNEPLCACCRAEKSLGIGRHLGARVFQKIYSESKEILNTNELKRHEISRKTMIEYHCFSCGQKTEKSARDVASPRGVGCNNKGCTRSARREYKYTVQDVLDAAKEKGLRINMLYRDDFDFKSQLSHTISTNDPVRTTCRIKTHQQHYQHLTNVATIMIGNTGCKVCAGAISQNELVVLTVIKMFYKGDIELGQFPSFMGTLQLDIWIPPLNLAIEVQGTQHYEFSRGLHKTQQCLTDIQDRNKKKLPLCQAEGVNLLVFDARKIEKNKGVLRDKIASCALSLLPELAKLYPKTFPPSLSRDGIDLGCAFFTQNREELISRKFIHDKKRFEAFCARKGLTIYGEFLGLSLPIKVGCEHQKPKSRKPEHIMRANKGSYCCTGQEASSERAIESAATVGFVVDTEASMSNDSCQWPPKKVGGSYFMVHCLCGEKQAKANINVLESKTPRYKPCVCITQVRSKDLISLYDEKDGSFYINKKRLTQNSVTAKNERNNRKKIYKKNEEAIIKYAKEFPEKGRLMLFKFLASLNYNVSEDCVRKTLEKHNLNNQQQREQARDTR